MLLALGLLLFCPLRKYYEGIPVKDQSVVILLCEFSAKISFLTLVILVELLLFLLLPENFKHH